MDFCLVGHGALYSRLCGLDLGYAAASVTGERPTGVNEDGRLQLPARGSCYHAPMDLDEWKARVRAESLSLELRSYTYVSYDDGRTSDGGTDFVLLFEQGGVELLAPDLFVRRPSQIPAQELETLWVEALQTDRTHIGIDTALSRGITVLRLRWEALRRVRTAQLAINHYSSLGSGPASWRLLLSTAWGELRQDLSPQLTKHFEFLVSRFRELGVPGPAFELGQAVHCVHGLVYQVPVGDGLWVRIGQRPGADGLYELRPSATGLRIFAGARRVADLKLDGSSAWQPEPGAPLVWLNWGPQQAYVEVDTRSSTADLFVQKR